MRETRSSAQGVTLIKTGEDNRECTCQVRRFGRSRNKNGREWTLYMRQSSGEWIVHCHTLARRKCIYARLEKYRCLAGRYYGSRFYPSCTDRGECFGEWTRDDGERPRHTRSAFDAHCSGRHATNCCHIVVWLLRIRRRRGRADVCFGDRLEKIYVRQPDTRLQPAGHGDGHGLCVRTAMTRLVT